jgi:transposase-like protein
MTADVHQEELRQLKATLENQRETGRRLRYPKDVRQRIQALRKAGVSVVRLEQELDIGPGIIYKWGRGRATTDTKMPRVMTVTPEPSAKLPATLSAAQQRCVDTSLSLQVGAFCITIKLAGD